MDILPIASGSSGNAYRITDGETALLLDAGIPIKAIQVALKFRLQAMAGCFISHCHGDHSKAAKDLIRLGVDIYTGRGTVEACGLQGHRVHITTPLEQVQVGTFDVLPFDVQHDAPDSQGFLFTSRATGEKLLYFTDTYYLKYRFTGLTHIMAECNYSKEALQRSVAAGDVPIDRVPRLMRSHMSLEHLKDMLNANDLTRLQQIYLLHLSNDNSDEGAMKKEIERLTGVEVYVC
jgi:phosphoribosyl 1,2-cyclic phosphodiesterase